MTPAISSLFMVIGLWLALALFCCGGSSALTPTSKTDNASPIVVTAPTLVAEYEANEIAADEKYKDRKVLVTGRVDSIAKDLLDSMYVTLDSGKEFSITSVQCFFDDSEKRNLASLVKGLSLTVKCRCEGKFGNVMLKECVIKGVRN